jgi:hypothetical protein
MQDTCVLQENVVFVVNYEKYLNHIAKSDSYESYRSIGELQILQITHLLNVASSNAQLNRSRHFDAE